MRHPFDGIILPENPARRSWLRGLFAAIAGLFGANIAYTAAPPPRKAVGPAPNPEPTTEAVGEEGAKSTTTALREAGGKATTRALNEEGAAKPKPRPKGPGKVTTLALNEE